jgi:hypothetical protein
MKRRSLRFVSIIAIIGTPAAVAIVISASIRITPDCGDARRCPE